MHDVENKSGGEMCPVAPQLPPAATVSRRRKLTSTTGRKDPPPENFTGPDLTITVVLASSAPSPSLFYC